MLSGASVCVPLFAQLWSSGLSVLLFAVEDLHLVCVVAGTCDSVDRNSGFDCGYLFRCERDIESGEAFAELVPCPCADEWNDGGILGENPGNCELGLRDAFAGCDLG